jgi:hypothetical protein
VYRYPAANTGGLNFFGNITATGAYLHLGSKGMVLHGGEYLEILGSSLTATGGLLINGEAIEVPAFMFWKIL